MKQYTAEPTEELINVNKRLDDIDERVSECLPFQSLSEFLCSMNSKYCKYISMVKRLLALILLLSKFDQFTVRIHSQTYSKLFNVISMLPTKSHSK